MKVVTASEYAGGPSLETHRRATDFARWAQSLALAKGDALQATKIFESRWPDSKSIELIRKFAVMPGTTTDGSWAGPLAEMSQLSSAFVEMLRPRTVLGRLSGFRRVPFNVKFPRATSGSSVGWVGQNRVTPVSSLALDQVTFKSSKIGGIVVISDETARSATRRPRH